jgi:hypothetical protein
VQELSEYPAVCWLTSQEGWKVRFVFPVLKPDTVSGITVSATSSSYIGDLHLVTRRNDVIETCNLCYAGAYVVMNQVSNFYPWPKSAIQVTKSSCIGQGGKSPCLPAPKHTAFAALAVPAEPCES